MLLTFVSECKQHEHYEHLNPRPERFSQWQEDRGIIGIGTRLK